MIKKSIRFILLLLPLAALGVSLHIVDLAQLKNLWGKCSPSLLITAGALNLLLIGIKSIQWMILLQEKAAPLFFKIFRAMTLWMTADHWLPFRMADVTKLELLSLASGHPRPRIIGGMVTETFAACVALLTILGLMVFSPFGPFFKGSWVALSGLFVLSGLLLLCLTQLRRRETLPWGLNKISSLRRILKETSAGMAVGNRARSAVVSLSFLSLLTVCLMLWIVQRAFGLSLSFHQTLFVMIAICLAVIVPISPGNLGVFELGALGAYSIVKVPSDLALACSLMFHAVLLFPTSLLAACFSFRAFLRLLKARGTTVVELEV